MKKLTKKQSEKLTEKEIRVYNRILNNEGISLDGGLTFTGIIKKLKLTDYTLLKYDILDK